MKLFVYVVLAGLLVLCLISCSTKKTDNSDVTQQVVDKTGNDDVSAPSRYVITKYDNSDKLVKSVDVSYNNGYEYETISVCEKIVYSPTTWDKSETNVDVKSVDEYYIIEPYREEDKAYTSKVYLVADKLLYLINLNGKENFTLANFDELAYEIEYSIYENIISMVN